MTSNIHNNMVETYVEISRRKRIFGSFLPFISENDLKCQLNFLTNIVKLKSDFSCS